MKKSFVKVVAIFSIIFMSFFIKNNSVIALECTYSLPQTYMDKSGTPAQLKIDYTHKKVIKSINSSSNIESLMLKCTESGCKIGIKTSSRLYTSSDKSTYLANPYYIIDINKKLTGQKCPNYLELKAKTFDMDMPTNGYKLSTTDEKNYINSLTNIYYETKKSNDKFNNITINNDPSTGKDFATYLASVGDLVFINTSLKEKYPSDNFNKFKKIMKQGGATDSVIKNLPIDQSGSNSITYTKSYYDATKTNWKNYMKKGIEYKNNNKTKSDSEKKHNTYTDVSGFAEATSYFENWFNNVSRYLFEEDLSFYREVYKYLYENDSDYTKIINTIDGMDSYNNAESSQSCLNNNPCSVYCNFDNTGKNYSCTNTTFTECTKSSTKYKSCYNAYNSCKNVPTSEYENCMRGKIGDEYTNLESKVTNFRKIIENLETSLAQDMVSNLSKVSSPTLNVEFNGPYKIKCSDVEIFHTIYVILQIAAPIAVILFGSFDYAKAVMASDIEKMEKAKKKFPKRLLLVLLFVFVPIIINAILSLYSMSTDKDIDTSLMYCVIKGS